MLNPNRYTNIAEPIPHGQHRIDKAVDAWNVMETKIPLLDFRDRLELEKQIDILHEYLIKLT
jgi:hypothetical protein